MEDLQKIIDSVGKAARAAEVEVVTGDTKVVARGSADKIFINTSGIGSISDGVNISGSNARPGDRIISEKCRGGTAVSGRAGPDGSCPFLITRSLKRLIFRAEGGCSVRESDQRSPGVLV